MKPFKANKTRIIFFVVGILILILLFKSFGVEKFINDICLLGWKFVLIVSLFLFNNVVLAYTWKVLINHPLRWKLFHRLVLARIAGDSTSSINSMGALAGEPIKALLMREDIPFNKGLASVVLDRTVHTLANTLLILTGIISSFFVLKLPVLVSTGFLLFIIFVLCAIFYILKKQKQGFIRFLVNRLPKKISSRFMNTEREKKIDELDSEIGFILSTRENLKRFYISLILRYFSILVTGTLEVFLILIFIDIDISLVNSMFVYIFTLFLTSIVFFMPANIGTSEASYSLALNFLGYDPALGLSVGIIRRLRTFVWSGIGMIILFYRGATNKSGDRVDE